MGCYEKYNGYKRSPFCSLGRYCPALRLGVSHTCFSPNWSYKEGYYIPAPGRTQTFTLPSLTWYLIIAYLEYEAWITFLGVWLTQLMTTNITIWDESLNLRHVSLKAMFFCRGKFLHPWSYISTICHLSNCSSRRLNHPWQMIPTDYDQRCEL